MSPLDMHYIDRLLIQTEGSKRLYSKENAWISNMSQKYSFMGQLLTGHANKLEILMT